VTVEQKEIRRQLFDEPHDAGNMYCVRSSNGFLEIEAEIKVKIVDDLSYLARNDARHPWHFTLAF
jgi:hypothetical protein